MANISQRSELQIIKILKQRLFIQNFEFRFREVSNLSVQSVSVCVRVRKCGLALKMVKKDSIIIVLLLAICYGSVLGKPENDSCPVDKYPRILKGGKRHSKSCTTFVPSNRMYQRPDNSIPTLIPIKPNNNSLLDNMREFCQRNFKNGIPLSYINKTAYEYHKYYTYMGGKASVHSAVEVSKTDGPRQLMRYHKVNEDMEQHTCYINTARYFDVLRDTINTTEMERCYIDYNFILFWLRGNVITPDWWQDYSHGMSNRELSRSHDVNCRCMQLSDNDEEYTFNSEVQECSIENCQFFACISSSYNNCVDEKIEQCTFAPNENICREYSYIRHQEADIPYGNKCPERDYGEMCECPCSDLEWSEWSAKSTTCGPYRRERYKVVKGFENVEVDCTQERYKCCISSEEGLQTDCRDYFINSNKTIMEHRTTCKKNNGAVVKTEAGYFCECSSNRYGVLCEEEYSFCEDNPNVCQNNGICINAGSSYICQCNSEYRGVNCTIEKVTCKTGLDCLNQGTCTKVNGKYVCMCPSLFTGKFCEFNTGMCKADTCKNGGTCVAFDSTRYTCKCEKDFKGAFCEMSLSMLEKYSKMLSESGIDILIIICLAFIGLFIFIHTIFRHMDMMLRIRRRCKNREFTSRTYKINITRLLVL
ncbi:Protein eyes shut [Trichinella nelsoni]|uniref:Protein eyes shut n=1 Tax=Trichinella nelsoni TaxID=6336 RepID=A0A0V0RKB8_9BILA|nr:Protein eyes shut [Trichinella nelsoni]